MVRYAFGLRVLALALVLGAAPASAQLTKQSLSAHGTLIPGNCLSAYSQTQVQDTGGTCAAGSTAMLTTGANATSSAVQNLVTNAGSATITASSLTLSGITLSGATLSGATTLPGSGRIQSGGGISIGTTTDPGSNNLLVAGTAQANGGFETVASLSASATTPVAIFQNSAAGDAVGIRIVGRQYAGGDQTAIDFVQNSLSNFQSAIVFSTNNGSSFAERGRFGTAGGFSVGTTTDPGAGNLLVNGNVTIGSASSATLATGELGATKIAASGSAPGAGYAKISWVAGTNAGTCKLISYAGTSTTPVTIVDNVGSGC